MKRKKGEKGQETVTAWLQIDIRTYVRNAHVRTHITGMHCILYYLATAIDTYPNPFMNNTAQTQHSGHVNRQSYVYNAAMCTCGTCILYVRTMPGKETGSPPGPKA